MIQKFKVTLRLSKTIPMYNTDVHVVKRTGDSVATGAPVLNKSPRRDLNSQQVVQAPVQRISDPWLCPLSDEGTNRGDGNRTRTAAYTAKRLENARVYHSNHPSVSGGVRPAKSHPAAPLHQSQYSHVPDVNMRLTSFRRAQTQQTKKPCPKTWTMALIHSRPGSMPQLKISVHVAH